MNYKLLAACGCNMGKVRKNNEDNFFIDGKVLEDSSNSLDEIYTTTSEIKDKLQVFGVFDGIGGHMDGEVASKMAADFVAKETAAVDQSETENLEDFFLHFAQNMNTEVWEYADEHFSNMGTTAVMLGFSGNQYCVCNVGDSRAYSLREGTYSQISKDHTDAELLEVLGLVNRSPHLTLFVGASPYEFSMNPYVKKGEIAIGDQYLLCSDGLTNMVSKEEIIEIMMSGQSEKEKVQALIQKALEYGGVDNITVILIRVDEE